MTRGGKLIALVATAAAVVALIAFAVANRPLITAPKGTAPLDNKLDTSAVAHLVVDEAGILSEKMEKAIAIYNANWNAMAGRVLAVVTVESTENAEEDAWRWMDRLALGTNDALLLMEAGGGRKCAVAANGTFRADLAEMQEGYLLSLTYMSMKRGEFDAAVLAVFDRFHHFYGYDYEEYRRTYVIEGTVTFCVLVALMMPILIHFVAEKLDGWRFKRWYDNYGQFDPSIMPWRTVFFWHRVGSEWYESRVSGEWIDYGKVLRGQRRERSARNKIRMFGGRRFR